MQKPILMFMGDDSICASILKTISDGFREGLEELGEEVIYLSARELCDHFSDSYAEYMEKDYKAVIAFLDVCYDNVMPGTDKPFFDYIKGPKFNYFTDHPIVSYKRLAHVPKDYYYLTLDRDYAEFVNRYYPAKAFYLPPGGCGVKNLKPFSQRQYGVSFLGTYADWKAVFPSDSNEDVQAVAQKYIECLVENPEATSEEALKLALVNLIGKVPPTNEFLDIMYAFSNIPSYGVSKLFREEIVKVILDAGITVNVFGYTWEKAPFANSPYLKIHDLVNSQNANEIYNNSKISLNTMTWHKQGLTERVIESMMAGSIALSDETTVLKECFSDKEDILLYSLRKIASIPQIIEENIDNESIAQRGYENVCKNHTWKNRAEEFLRILKGIN